MGVRGTVTATTPVLDVEDGVATARSTVVFEGLQAGVRTPLTGWAWLPLPAAHADVVLAHALSTEGGSGVLTLLGAEALALDVALPRPLRPFAGAVRGSLDRVLARFRERIDDAVAGRTVELFRLPERVPELGTTVRLAFEPGGLGYVGHSLRAAVGLRREPSAPHGLRIGADEAAR